MKLKNKQGLYALIASIVIQLCLGIAYIWSLFQAGIAESIFGGDNGGASLTFSLLLATLSIGSIIGGKLVLKYSTKLVVIIGGIIIALGFYLSSLANSSMPWILWVGYGIMGGIGMGFTYSTSIACTQKWYPKKKGLITGIVVAALGLGGVVFTPIIEYLIKVFGGTGVGENKTLMVLSILYLVVCTIGGLFLKDKKEDSDDSKTASKEEGLSPLQMLKSPKYYLIAVTFALACMVGLMMIGFAKPIAVAKGLSETATIGVLLISLLNSGGRLVWGTVSDKLGCNKTIMILLVGTCILSLLVNFANGYLVYVVIGLIGFFYGGFLSTFPTLTAKTFGTKHMATNYGFVLVGFGVGAILSSQIAGYYKNLAANDISLMLPAYIISSIGAAIGLILIYILGKLERKKQK